MRAFLLLLLVAALAMTAVFPAGDAGAAAGPIWSAQPTVNPRPASSSQSITPAAASSTPGVA